MPADARPRLAAQDQMTVGEFVAYRETRPVAERWELIEGVPVMSPSPNLPHQRIASNIVRVLGNEALRLGASWVPQLGVGTIVPASPNSLPQPDAMVLEHEDLDNVSSATSDALVLFEVLSRSNSAGDQTWRRKVYASVPNCRHYITVAQTSALVVRYDRDAAWASFQIKGLRSTLTLPALGAVALPLAEVYRWTRVGKRT